MATLIGASLLLLAIASFGLAAAFGEAPSLDWEINGEATQNGVRQYTSERERQADMNREVRHQWFAGGACGSIVLGPIGFWLLLVGRSQDKKLRETHQFP